MCIHTVGHTRMCVCTHTHTHTHHTACACDQTITHKHMHAPINLVQILVMFPWMGKGWRVLGGGGVEREGGWQLFNFPHLELKRGIWHTVLAQLCECEVGFSPDSLTIPFCSKETKSWTEVLYHWEDTASKLWTWRATFGSVYSVAFMHLSVLCGQTFNVGLDMHTTSKRFDGCLHRGVQESHVNITNKDH